MLQCYLLQMFFFAILIECEEAVEEVCFFSALYEVDGAWNFDVVIALC